jgi:hypothetical protein
VYLVDGTSFVNRGGVDERLFEGVGRVAQRSCACTTDKNIARVANTGMSLILYGLGKTEVFQQEDGSVLQRDRKDPVEVT